jgi:RNA polymerase sigma factor (sigma-70 family)
MRSFTNEALAQVIHDGPPPQRDEALTIIYERFQNALLRYATARLNDLYDHSDLAEDAVQEALKSFYDRVVKHGVPANVKSMLYGITKHKISDIRKKERKCLRLPQTLVSPFSLEGYALTSEMRQIVRRFLAEGHLTAYERRIWILREMLGYPPKTIADIVCRTPNAVSVTLRTARNKWKRFADGLSDALRTTE